MAELPQEKPQWRQDPVTHCNESEPSDSLYGTPSGALLALRKAGVAPALTGETPG